MNSLFQQLHPQNQVNSLPSNLQQMISRFKMITNPKAYVTQALNSNPQLQSLIQASGGNPETAFKNLAKQMNVNPDDIINMLK